MLRELGCLDEDQRAVRALDALRRQPSLWGGPPVLFYGFDDLTRAAARRDRDARRDRGRRGDGLARIRAGPHGLRRARRHVPGAGAARLRAPRATGAGRVLRGRLAGGPLAPRALAVRARCRACRSGQRGAPARGRRRARRARARGGRDPRAARRGHGSRGDRGRDPVPRRRRRSAAGGLLGRRDPARAAAEHAVRRHRHRRRPRGSASLCATPRWRRRGALAGPARPGGRERARLAPRPARLATRPRAARSARSSPTSSS